MAMPEVHRGGVAYSYWSSTPWLEDVLDDTTEDNRFYQALQKNREIDPDTNPRLHKRSKSQADAPSAGTSTAIESSGVEPAMPGRSVDAWVVVRRLRMVCGLFRRRR